MNASSPEFIEVWQTRMREVYYIFGATCSVSGCLLLEKYLTMAGPSVLENPPFPMDLGLHPVAVS